MREKKTHFKRFALSQGTTGEIACLQQCCDGVMIFSLAFKASKYQRQGRTVLLHIPLLTSFSFGTGSPTFIGAMVCPYKMRFCPEHQKLSLTDDVMRLCRYFLCKNIWCKLSGNMINSQASKLGCFPPVFRKKLSKSNFSWPAVSY